MADIQLSTLGAVIKEAYENEADTNVFSDSEKAKLQSLPNYQQTNINLSESGLIYSQTITHNLGYKPVVKIIDSNGVEVEMYVEHTSNNAVLIKSLVDIAGKIIVS